MAYVLSHVQLPLPVAYVPLLSIFHIWKYRSHDQNMNIPIHSVILHLRYTNFKTSSFFQKGTDKPSHV